MEHATLEIIFGPWPSDPNTITIDKIVFHPLGDAKVDFMFMPNIGEGAKPISAIASGGELSRIMLAIKSVAIQKNNNFDKTYLFDEVDAGIGGQTAERIGQRMAVLASGQTQVLNVTHLAQVAAYADQHAKVQKQTVRGRTKTSIDFLNKEERRQELARMIGGIELTPKTFEFATELLEKKDKDILHLRTGQL